MKTLLAILLLLINFSAVSSETTYKDWEVSYDEKIRTVYTLTASEVFSNVDLMIGFNPKNNCLPAVSIFNYQAGDNTERLPKKGAAVSTWRIDSREGFEVESTLTSTYDRGSDTTIQLSTFHLKDPQDGTADQRFLLELIRGNYLRIKRKTSTDAYEYDRFSLAGSSKAVKLSVDMCLAIEQEDKKYFDLERAL